MSELFLSFLNRAIAAGWLVLAVVLARMLLKKAPKWVLPVLWGLVALRLVLPFSIESVLSLLPSAETVPAEIVMSREPAIDSGVSFINSAVNPVLQSSFAPAPAASANPLQIWVPLLGLVWLVGVAAMLLYAAVSYLRLRRRVQTAVRLQENIWQSEQVDSPFVLGLLRPRIYLPFALTPEQRASVIAHEQAHIRRRDHLIKPFAFLLLALYWFQPLLWLAYILLCRDIELACDEKVIRDMDPAQRADYSQALLACSVKRGAIAACPLAFGEVGVKQRVKRVLNYKKPAFWLILLAVLACAALSVWFLTDPVSCDFDFSGRTVTWAKTMDLRSGEPTSFYLSEAERDELTGRLRDLKIGKKNDDYQGFTPFYAVYVSEGVPQSTISHTQDVFETSFALVGFEASGKHTAIQWEGVYYEIKDEDFCDYLSRFCAGKTRVEAPGETTDRLPAEIVKDGVFWFDYLPDPTMLPDAPLEATHGDFPGVTFRWDYDSICAITDQGEEPILQGMPIWNAIFQDVTGDGAADLCVTSSYGSGLIDTRVQVYDYANGAAYVLEDRGYYDYALSFLDRNLYVSKYAYPMEGAPVSVGYLAVKDSGSGWELAMATLPRGDPEEPLYDLEQVIHYAIQQHNTEPITTYLNGDFTATSFVTLAELVGDGAVGQEPRAWHTVYGLALFQWFRYKGNGFETVSGSHVPVVLSFEISSDGAIRLVEYWEPRDGAYFAEDVREKFPDWTWEDALDTQKYITAQEQSCYARAVQYAETWGGLDVNAWIEELLADGSEQAMRELNYLGDYALRYIFGEFLKGGQTGEKAQRMLAVMSLGAEGLEMPIETPQSYFDAWKDHTVALARQNDMTFMKENHPKGYLLLQVMGEILAAESEEAP